MLSSYVSRCKCGSLGSCLMPWNAGIVFPSRCDFILKGPTYTVHCKENMVLASDKLLVKAHCYSTANSSKHASWTLSCWNREGPSPNTSQIFEWIDLSMVSRSMTRSRDAGQILELLNTFNNLLPVYKNIELSELECDLRSRVPLGFSRNIYSVCF